MKKFLTTLLIGGLMAGSIFAFGGAALPGAYQPLNAPVYQRYQQVKGGYWLNDENLIEVKGTVESISTEEDFPGILFVTVKTEDGNSYIVHVNARYAVDLKEGDSVELKGWITEFKDEKIFRPVEAKVNGEEVYNRNQFFRRTAVRPNVRPYAGKPFGYNTMPNKPIRRPYNNNFRRPGSRIPMNYYGRTPMGAWERPMMNYNYPGSGYYNEIPGYTPKYPHDDWNYYGPRAPRW
ncbi:hypothetical protein XO10_03470 [Marinitoga sp. 1135]|uniref:hypothetical protein n=1 Tax=Marinitoga sp. 1135 TaxID=1643333 RepID=UPI001586E05E|nr:hypothetical protein [Marinitoga sp. 1135]NUU95333.1 hypothetical protein [Marinitoga sp. 1135]